MTDYIKALNTDGVNEYVDCGHIAIADNLSVVGWINCGSQSVDQVIFLNGANISSDLGWFVSINNIDARRLRFWVSSDGTATATTMKYYRSPGSDLPVSGQAQVAFTWATGVLKIFVNGAELVPTKVWDPAFTTIFGAVGNCNIGGRAGVTVMWGNQVCNVSIWDTGVLTPADIATLYNGGLNMDSADLVPAGAASLRNSWLWNRTLPLVPGVNDVPDNTGANPGTTQNMEAGDVVNSPWPGGPWAEVTRTFIHNRATRISDGARTTWASSNGADPAMAYHPDVVYPADYEDFVVIGGSYS